MSLRDRGRGVGTTKSNLQSLVVAVNENAAALPDVTVEKAAVESALSDTEDAIRRRDFHLAQGRKATKDIRTALARGLDAGIRLQNAARFKLGTKDEKLLEFQLKLPGKRPSPAVKRANVAEQQNEILKEQVAKLADSSKDEIKGDKTT